MQSEGDKYWLIQTKSESQASGRGISALMTKALCNATSILDDCDFEVDGYQSDVAFGVALWRLHK
jgi:hypothetical protein